MTTSLSTAMASRRPELHANAAERKLRTKPSSVLRRFLTCRIAPAQSVIGNGMFTSWMSPGWMRSQSSKNAASRTVVSMLLQSYMCTPIG